jgi:lipopolysaccharide transport system ATP-binding protein
MNQYTAIKVIGISKSFRIPQEKRNTIREHVTGFRKKMVYETFSALEDVSFEVKRGEFFSIIGRNGSGKSTLLKILAGIYSADNGRVIVNGEISPFLELGVGFNPELSGKDNIYLNGTILGLSKFELDRNYRKIVNFSELNRFIHLKVKNYSSGMQVRLAFSVAIHANKEILLMDEVLAVGDANFQVKCFNVFEDFIREGKTIIFVSHDMPTVQKYSDRVLYLESGKPSFVGRRDEAVSKYMYTDVIKDQEKPAGHGLTGAVDETRRDRGKDGRDKAELATMDAVTDGDRDVEKLIEIVDVQVKDDAGMNVTEIANGQTFFINVNYHLKKDLTDLIFGIIIYDQKKRALFTTNTFTEQIKTGKISYGRIRLKYRITNYLAAGKYMVSATVSDKTQRVFYDWKDEAQSFMVVNVKRLMSYGGVDLPHEILVDRDQPAER